MRLSSRLSHLKPTAVNEILAEVRAQREQHRDVISLMRGEPDFPTPPHIAEAAHAAIRDGRTRYADNRGEPGLRAAIATKLQRDNGLSYDRDREILVTTGATLGIQAALMALIDEGDEVLVPDPVYDAYASPIRLAGGSVRPVPCVLDRGRFTLTPSALQAAVTPRSRALILNTPWNPVGTVFTGTELLGLAAVIETHGLALISDEIYEGITYGDARHVSPAGVSPALRERTVIVNSLSKTYAMTGWRVGYCAAPAAIIDAMLLVLQQTSRGPATFVQDAAAIALTASQVAVADMRAEYASRRQLVCDTLRPVPRIAVLPPDGGFFAMLDIRQLGRSSNEVRQQLLRDFGVAVVHGAAYGPGGEGTLRVSFGSGGETLAAGLDRLAVGLTEIGSR